MFFLFNLNKMGENVIRIYILCKWQVVGMCIFGENLPLGALNGVYWLVVVVGLALFEVAGEEDDLGAV